MQSGPSSGHGAESDIVFNLTGMKSTQLGTYLIGACCILAGGLVAYFLNPMLGIIIMGIGGLIFGIGVVAETYPWAFLVVFLLAALAVVITGVYLVVKQRQLNKTAVTADDNAWAFDKLVAAIDTFTKAHPDKAQDIRNAVTYEADDEYQRDFKEMVLASKTRQGVKPTSPYVQAELAKKV